QSKTPDGVLRGLRFMEERTLELSISRPGKTVERTTCKWELLDGPEGVGKGDWLLKRTAPDCAVSENALQFWAGDQIKLRGPFGNDDWIVAGPDGTATYHRKK